jgi:hypothetical protein
MVWRRIATSLVGSCIWFGDAHRVEDGKKVQGVALLQQDSVKFREKMVIEEEPGRYTYRDYQAQPALIYFQEWAQGAVDLGLERIVDENLVLLGSSERTHPPTSEQSVAMINDARLHKCPEVTQMSALELYSNVTDHHGVHHMLYHTESSMLQFVAVKGDHILHADPAPCAASQLQEPNLAEKQDTVGGGRKLAQGTDQIVQDCKKLFHRTAKGHCDKDYDLEFVTTTIAVVGGIEVKVKAKLTSGDGERTSFHEIDCDFLTSLNQDASLLQQLDPPELGDDELPEERNGMIAILSMFEDICDIPDENGPLTDEEIEGLLLMEHQTFG